MPSEHAGTAGRTTCTGMGSASHAGDSVMRRKLCCMHMVDCCAAASATGNTAVLCAWKMHAEAYASDDDAADSCIADAA